MDADDPGVRSEAPGAWSARLPEAFLVIAMVVSTWLVLHLTQDFTFIQDEWDPLLNRPGWGLDQIFAPFNGHPTMIPVVIYKAVQEVFGMDSARPVQIIHAGLLLVMNGVLFVYLRRRVGDWAALIGTVMVLFLGAAFEVLLFPFTMNFVGAIAAGIGALLALDRDDRRGDITASFLLVVGLCFSLVVLPFIAAAGVEWLVNRRDRRSRWFVPAIPVALLVVWWLVWGRDAGVSSFSVSNIPTAPTTAFEALGSGFMSLFGLADGSRGQDYQPNLVWGCAIAVVAIGLAVWRLKRIGRPLPLDFLVAGTALLAFVLILGLTEDETRQPVFSRFQLPLVVLILMTASTLLRGIRLKPSWLVVAAIIAALSVQSGVRLLEVKAEEKWSVASRYFRTYLTGLELAGPDAVSARTAEVGPWVTVSPVEYIEVSDRYGSPSYEGSEIRGLMDGAYFWLDSGLIDGTGAGLDDDRRGTTDLPCRRMGSGWRLEAAPGSYRVENRSPSEVTILIARLGSGVGTEVGSVPPRSSSGLELPAGDLVEPWRVSFEPASSSVSLCGPS